jgi:hypothetical protein
MKLIQLLFIQFQRSLYRTAIKLHFDFIKRHSKMPQILYRIQKQKVFIAVISVTCLFIYMRWFQQADFIVIPQGMRRYNSCEGIWNEIK